MRGILDSALAFFHHEAAGRIVLVVAALQAPLASNPPLASSQHRAAIRPRPTGHRSVDRRKPAAERNRRPQRAPILLMLHLGSCQF
jgi:hypothetical protein